MLFGCGQTVYKSDYGMGNSTVFGTVDWISQRIVMLSEQEITPLSENVEKINKKMNSLISRLDDECKTSREVLYVKCDGVGHCPMGGECWTWDGLCLSKYGGDRVDNCCMYTIIDSPVEK